MSKKMSALSPVAQKILDYIELQDGEVTFANIKAEFPEANPAHLRALSQRGLVSAELTEVTEYMKVTKKVNTYGFLKQSEKDE